MAYRVGIIGCGRMGGTIDDETESGGDFMLPYGHANAYAAVAETELVAAADVVSEKLQGWCDRFGVRGRYTDYREMIQKEDLDIVSVTTNCSQRAEPIVYASNNGVRGIYAEKALCASLAELDSIAEACRRNKTHLAYGAMRRYYPGFEIARRIVESGQLGRPLAALWGGANATPRLFHGGSHFVDVLMYMLGDPNPEYAQAELVSQGVGEFDAVEDPDGALQVRTDPRIVFGAIRFEDGKRLIITDIQAGEAEITCERGVIRTRCDSADYRMRRMVGEPWKKGWQWEDLDFPIRNPHSATVSIIKDLVRSMETGEPGRSNLEVARRGMEILFGFVESHRRGGARVRLPLEDRRIWVNSA